MADYDPKFIDGIIERLGKGRENLIAILQAIQGEYHWLPPQALERVCELTEIRPAEIVGVATFYDQFRHRPAGLYRLKVCIGTACHVKGANVIYDAFQDYLKIPKGEDTDAKGVFTLEKVACLGCCTLAPAVQIEDVTYGYLTTDTVGKVLDDFLSLQAARGAQRPAAAAVAGPPAGEIRISLDTCCMASGSGKVYRALQRAVAELGINVEVKNVGCQGLSYIEPWFEVLAPGRPPAVYARAAPEDCRDIVARHFPPPKLSKRLLLAASRSVDRLLTDETWEGVNRFAVNIRDPLMTDFVGRQVRLATKFCGQRRPTDIEEYLASDGFHGLRRCLEGKGPEQVIAEIKAAGVRGRGGGGYPTGLKWSLVRAAEGTAKYVVCNGDEGDPGAFMDRMLLESQPYRVLEGMIIAAYAVGATEGVLYIRHEYPIAVRRVREAIDVCYKRGYLGDGILGTKLRLHLRVMEGAGAFVCGEETALLASIEGRRGMPRLRPPYPAEHGLWGKPTLVNNVETYSLIPWVINNGPEKFAAMGTEGSKGTKVFALAGKVRRGGLIEVPMGITLRQVVEEVGGGVPGGRKLKAVQVGGPSGGCIPESLCDTPIDYEALTHLGAMMGSGGMVVLDDGDCMVDIARYFLDFTCNQSCGKCTFCRIGTHHMLDILTRLCNGQGRADDLPRLQALAEDIRSGSLCGLGKTAPNPVLTTMRYFREEYDAHVAGHCPAKACRGLITYRVTDDCIGCTLCAQGCPADAIAFRPHEKHEIDATKCVRCGACKAVCPVNAVEVD